VLVFDADEITVGRRSESRAIAPDVDLSGDLADPGVSHAHAVIRRDGASGTYSVVDLGSTNGTTLNDDEESIRPHELVLLKSGDRIHVGAWTTICTIG
jgi:pSer/pThr/pTyr-binding forkhead associated (FHA) protein